MTPTWLQRLRRLRQRVGRPLIDDIVADIDLSEQFVLAVFSHKTEPRRPELALIVEALTSDQQEIDSVLTAYDNRHEPAPPLPEVPAWLRLLRVERFASGQPSLRELAAKSGLSDSHIGDIIGGRILPSFNTLLTLVNAITVDAPAIDGILSSYEDVSGPERAFPELDFDARSDTRILADAINNLAAAIRSLEWGKPDHH